VYPTVIDSNGTRRFVEVPSMNMKYPNMNDVGREIAFGRMPLGDYAAVIAARGYSVSGAQDLSAFSEVEFTNMPVKLLPWTDEEFATCDVGGVRARIYRTPSHPVEGQWSWTIETNDQTIFGGVYETRDLAMADCDGREELRRATRH
jgi:hypothetical protein